MFPVTLNGNTYNLADFQGADYAQKFAKFSYDLVMDRLSPTSTSAGSLVAASTTSVTPGVGAKAFTVPAGKGFLAGMQVTAYRLDTLGICAMHGVVSSYVSNSLTIEVKVVNSGDATASANWIIMAAPVMESRSGTFTAVEGGTGTTTVATALDALRVPHLQNRPEYMDDMEGRLEPNSSPYLGMASVLSAKRITWTQLGASIRAPSLRDLYAEGVPNLGNHPGIIELAVKNQGSKAVMAVNNYGMINFNSTSHMHFECGFYIPEFSEDPTEDFDLWIGLAKAGTNIGTTVEGSTFENAAHSAVPSNWIVAALNYRTNGPSVEGQISSPPRYITKWEKKPGWAVMHMTRRFTTSFMLGISREDITTSEHDTWDITGNADTAADLATPIIVLQKKAGSGKTFKVYLDYWYFSLPGGAAGPNLSRA